VRLHGPAALTSSASPGDDLSGGGLSCPRALIFDLDGTLVDSLQDLAAAMNVSLAQLGLPVWPPWAYRVFVGEGVAVLVQRVLPSRRQHLAAELRRLFLQEYAASSLRHSRPYPGIPELLGHLADRGLPCAVLSNKPHQETVQMVAGLFPTVPFVAVHGQRAEGPRKPDPTQALDIVAGLGIPPAQCWLVGDTAVDVQTARAAGMVSVGVLWGYRGVGELTSAGARLLIRQPGELLTALDRLAAPGLAARPPLAGRPDPTPPGEGSSRRPRGRSLRRRP